MFSSVWELPSTLANFLFNKSLLLYLSLSYRNTIHHYCTTWDTILLKRYCPILINTRNTGTGYVDALLVQASAWFLLYSIIFANFFQFELQTSYNKDIIEFMESIKEKQDKSVEPLPPSELDKIDLEGRNVPCCDHATKCTCDTDPSILPHHTSGV